MRPCSGGVASCCLGLGALDGELEWGQRDANLGRMEGRVGGTGREGDFGQGRYVTGALCAWTSLPSYEASISTSWTICTSPVRGLVT